ncbi:MAG: YgeY family selenium metabolism-linked hydrolase [Kiritimatiellia bacterium]|jgi:putative selenium metabolism hydrolase|nr:YgeY family selenium metabolism-linked hydrolase [Kiritimatiellia bacterium]MDP6631764.1 YgeY family selenium metabolism-linked hydrolase [Kiritimatiellia bacterium]MDP6810482.1 YgeY family selenium metabolism-linked hydrolase [Kiritimatiellia bacterium]MDP7025000.1 YgeY family selenium metabolism-linked hydrolase [Kiritimatiellia bacterium]
MSTEWLIAAQEMRKPLVGFLSDIVAIPSLSREERDVVARIAAEMEALGYDEVRIDGMGNVLGRIGNGKTVIALDGHCDTVDVGDRSQWETDPFVPVIRDGRFYGRGASDQKSGVASAVYAGGLLKRMDAVPADVTLYVVASVQEEDCDGLCWQYLVNEEALRPDVVVLTEPTNLRVHIGQRGRMELEISTTGISCHGSAPERGENAVYRMAPIIQDIEALNERLPPQEPFGKGSVTISQVRSESPSLCAVADGCTIHLDRRLTKGESESTSVAELEALASVCGAAARVSVLEYANPSYTGLVYPTRKYYPTWCLDPSAPQVQRAQKAFRTVFDREPETGYWTFSTNGVATAGLFDIPTLGFGPGEEAQAHAPNEHIEIDQLVQAAAFYCGFVDSFTKQ